MNNQHADNTAMISFSSVTYDQEPEMIKFVKEVIQTLLIYDINIVTGASIFNNGLAEYFEEMLKNYDSGTTIEVAMPICLADKFLTQDNKDFITRLENTGRFEFSKIGFYWPDRDEKELLCNHLTQMRNYLVNKSSIFVLTGGKTEGYLGSMPGLEEELRLVEEKIKSCENQYLFLYRHFGGVINEERIKPIVYNCDPGLYALNLEKFDDMLENRKHLNHVVSWGMSGYPPIE